MIIYVPKVRANIANNYGPKEPVAFTRSAITLPKVTQFTWNM